MKINQNFFSRMKSLFVLMALVVSVFPAMAQRTGHYAERVALFDSEKPLCSSDIVFLGNSLTEGGDWVNLFSESQRRLQRSGGRIANRGIIGDDAPGIYDRLYQILPAHPKKIFLLVGVNDISHHLTADSVVRAIAKVVDKIRTDSPQTKLYLQTLLPINESFKRYKNLNGKSAIVVEVNEGLKKMAKERGIKCIDLYPLFVAKERANCDSDMRSGDSSSCSLGNVGVLDPALTKDGLHLVPAGYEIWRAALMKYVK